ncbi:Uncharacterised protein [Bordetella pertussis]|nr:Uncharacterised protein [Bordetella pertussis]CFW47411.1 Uncharacterised protein [Bordetella pertussis]
MPACSAARCSRLGRLCPNRVSTPWRASARTIAWATVPSSVNPGAERGLGRVLMRPRPE